MREAPRSRVGWGFQLEQRIEFSERSVLERVLIQDRHQEILND